MASGAPNILFITSDQQRPGGLGVEDGRLRTPHLDRLAGEGMLLSRSYTCCPICTPARATWLTGQYPSRHGAWTVGTVLDPNCLSVAGLLGQAGYKTGIIGKSHFQPILSKDGRSLEGLPRYADTAFHRRWHGPWYGFEHAEINCGHVDEAHSASMHYRAWLEDKGVDIAAHFGRRDVTFWAPWAWSLPEEFHPCAWVSERATEYLRGHAARGGGQPFYLNVHFPEPHPPMHVPRPWFGMYDGTPVGAPTRRWGEWEGKPTVYRAAVEGRIWELGWHDRMALAGLERHAEVLAAGPGSAERYTELEAGLMRTYWAMISLMDAHVGRVLGCLEELGLAENTLVVFTSDHGELLGDHFVIGKGPCHYDACVRVPTLVRWPGRVPAGVRSGALTSCVDLAPSFLAAAGLPVHREMQGVNQLDVWRGRAEAARAGVWVDFRAERGLYVNSWITQRHRLSVHHTPAGEEVELYDLQEDPNEFVNLAADGAEAGLVARLQGQLLRECTTTAQAWQERIAFA